MPTVSVGDAFGKKHSVDYRIAKMAVSASARYSFIFNSQSGVGGYVYVGKRSKSCLALNDDEPRRWIVYTTGNTESTEKLGIYVSFHSELGGPDGAITQAGLLVGQLTHS